MTEKLPSADEATRRDGSRLSEGLGAWVSTDERLPEEGQSVAFVVRACNRLDYLNGKVLGGYYRAGPFGGFGVPGMTVDAWYWMPLPDAPAVPAVAASA